MFSRLSFSLPRLYLGNTVFSKFSSNTIVRYSPALQFSFSKRYSSASQSYQNQSNPSNHRELLARRTIVSNKNDDYVMAHPIWSQDQMKQIQQTSRIRQCFVDSLAYWTIQTIRFNFDWMSGWKFRFGNLESKSLTRIIFLESIAAIPGSIGGTLRHLASLRNMRRDHGWIHSLLLEAENERMHLLTAIQLKNPGRFMRSMVFLSQGLFYNFFWVSYMISPKFCHRLVGYLEEEAVKTYTKMLADCDAGLMPSWNNVGQAPEIARKYWKLPETATMRDVIALIRADEAHHRDVNHVFGDLKPNQLNPFKAGC